MDISGRYSITPALRLIVHAGTAKDRSVDTEFEQRGRQWSCQECGLHGIIVE